MPLAAKSKIVAHVVKAAIFVVLYHMSDAISPYINCVECVVMQLCSYVG